MGNSETKPIVNREIKRAKYKSTRPLPPLPIEEEESDSDNPPSHPPPPPPKEEYCKESSQLSYNQDTDLKD